MKLAHIVISVATALAAIGALQAAETAKPVWAVTENDLGAVEDGVELTHLTLLLKRPPDRQAAFEELLRSQQDPTSPQFHRWLTATEIGERFGAPQHAISSVTSWLQERQLRVTRVSQSGVRIEFAGTAANVGAAFGVRLHSYKVGREERVAPDAAPGIPEALSDTVSAVHGLVTIDERPLHQVTGTGVAFAHDERPDLTSCTSTSCIHYITPADFATIYDLNPVYAQKIDGTGQTVAILGRARVNLPDIENFQARTRLAMKDPVIVVPPNGVDPGPAMTSPPADTSTGIGDQGEATLDVTRVAGTAPGATILLVVSLNSNTASGLMIGGEYVVDSTPPAAQVMTISFSSCERNVSSTYVPVWDSIFSQAAAEGISVFVSSGDSGAATCDKAFDAPPASQSASINALCASTHVTCVGGTQFSDLSNPNLYWSSTNATNKGSAVSYIAEGAWNEPTDRNGAAQIAATGGGTSTYIATPSWQLNLGLTGRGTPDVSFSAAGHDPYFSCSSLGIGDCVLDSSNFYHFTTYSGTSASTPSLAAIAALLNQKMGSAQGNLAPHLYGLAQSSAGVFHDVTAATSGVGSCDLNVPSMCNNSTTGLAGYAVGPGYDLATGLGSIDVGNLFTHWSDPIVTANSPGALSGLWWNANESGWGISFTQRRNVVFAAWFTYDSNGKPKWYVASDCEMPAGVTGTSGTCNGQLYQVTGPTFFGATFDPHVVDILGVGNLKVAFQNANAATMTYTVNGQGRTVSIVRQPIQTGTILPAIDYTDLWWNPNESGWGMAITQQYDVMFLAWYVYDANHNPVWYVATDCVVSSNGCTGSVYSTTGPPLGPGFDPHAVQVSTVGTITATFSDPNNGVLTYTVNGVSGSKAITRQLF